MQPKGGTTRDTDAIARAREAATEVGVSGRRTPPGEWMLLEDVAAELGVSRATVGEWASRCMLPHRKLPGRRRIFVPRADFAAWMDGCELEVRRLADGGRVVKPKKRAA